MAVYETGQQLRRDAATDTAVIPDAANDQRRLKNYYRSHDLPAGWEVGTIAPNAEGEIAVPLHFSPGIGSARYGDASRPGEIHTANACPATPAGLWATLAAQRFVVVVNDKTGVIARIPCTADEEPAP